MAIYKPDNCRLKYLDFQLLNLKSGEQQTWVSSNSEVVIVIIEGDCVITQANFTYELSRKNVFDEKPEALYLGPGKSINIQAKVRTKLAMCMADADKEFPTKHITKNTVQEEERGKAGFKRHIINIVNTETETSRIAVGETFNFPGQWSSFPPHKHDAFVPGKEVPLEEIYYFRNRPETGFGFQRLYTKDSQIDQAIAVKDGDIVYLPKGYHPVASMPGHELYYLWMLAGNERTYTWNTDPDYQWLE
jgi:5-deoxy-glucuronate isomerase